MTDHLFCLVSDGPCQAGEEVTYKHYSLLRSAIEQVLPNMQYTIQFLTPDYKPNPTMSDVQPQIQGIYDKLYALKPRVILAFGEAAFKVLHLANTKISEICSIPQTSEILVKDMHLDERSPKAKMVNLIDPDPIRGTYVTKRGVMYSLAGYTPIIYPTYKYGSMCSYGSGYKGLMLVERQLARIKEILENPNFAPYKPEHYTKFIKIYSKKNQVPEAIETLSRLVTWKKYSFDIETAGYQVPQDAQLDFRHIDAEITMIAIGTDKECYVFNTHSLSELIPYIKPVLENQGVHITWNGRFDINFLENLWGVKFDGHTHIDGMACLYLNDMNVQFLGKGASTLKSSCASFLQNGAYYAGYQKNAGIDEAIHSGDGAYLAEHEDEFMLYCGIDVLMTYSTAAVMFNKLDQPQRKLVTVYYPDLDNTLNDIHKGGIKVDEPLMKNFMENLETFCDSTKIEITKLAGNEKFNPSSPIMLSSYLYDTLKLPPFYTEKGTLSVTTEVLDHYNCIPFCKMVSDYRGFLKQLEIFSAIKKHIHNARCYPFYNMYRTTSGRLTAKNPPIQIIPSNKKIETRLPVGLNLGLVKNGKVAIKRGKKLIETDQIINTAGIVAYLGRPLWPIHEIENGVLTEVSPNFKQIFISDIGQEMLYADYSQLEIVILANFIDQCSKDHALQDAIREGRDLHSFTCSKLFSILKKQTFTEEFIRSNKNVEPYHTWRSDSKAVIFKLIYGGTYKSFARDKCIPEDEAKLIFDTFLQVFPGIRDYMNAQDRFAHAENAVKTYAGHRRDLEVYRYESYNGKARNIALNHPIQGTASFFVNEAMVEYNTQLRKLGGSILLTVHDSIASQAPEAIWQQAAKLKQDTMTLYIMEKYKKFITVPLRVEMFHGKNWSELELAT